MSQNSWTIAGQSALADLGGLALRVDLTHPAAGVAVTLAGQGHAPPMQLLGVRLPSHLPGDSTALGDAYARGGDLVATYLPTPQRPLRVQVYWRLAAGDWGRVPARRESPLHVERQIGPQPGLILDCLVSVQTSLLESASRLAVHSHLPPGEVLRPGRGAGDALQPLPVGRSELRRADGPGWVLLRPDGAGVSYAEMIHPDDFTFDDLAPDDGGLRLVHRLFGGELEKGVILRARLRGAILPREADGQSARAAYEDLLRAPPPLTA
jgi:hypothetical protein